MMHEIFREKYIGTTYLYSKMALCTGNGFWVQRISSTTTQQHFVLHLILLQNPLPLLLASFKGIKKCQRSSSMMKLASLKNFKVHMSKIRTASNF